MGFEAVLALINQRHSTLFSLVFIPIFVINGGFVLVALAWICALVVSIIISLIRPQTKLPVPNQRFAVLLTGGTSGIGTPTALEFASQGFTVFATVRDLSSGEKLMQVHHSIVPVVMDVTQPDLIAQAAKMVETVLEEKRMSLLAIINNAGYAHFGFMEAVTQDVIQNYHSVNIQGPVLVTNAFLPLLRRFSPQSMSINTNLKPKVIFVSSVLSKYSVAGSGLIAASKHAIDAIACSYRQELSKQDIQVSVIAPGPINTRTNPDFLPIKAKAQDGLIDQSEGVLEYYSRAEKRQDEEYKANYRSSGIMARSDPSVVAKLFLEAVTSSFPLPRYEAGKFAVLTSIFIPWFWPAALDLMGTRLFTPLEDINNELGNEKDDTGEEKKKKN